MTWELGTAGVAVLALAVLLLRRHHLHRGRRTRITIVVERDREDDATDNGSPRDVAQ